MARKKSNKSKASVNAGRASDHQERDTLNENTRLLKASHAAPGITDSYTRLRRDSTIVSPKKRHPIIAVPQHKKFKSKMSPRIALEVEANSHLWRITSNILDVTNDNGEFGNTQQYDASAHLFTTARDDVSPTVTLPVVQTSTSTNGRRATGKRKSRHSKQRRHRQHAQHVIPLIMVSPPREEGKITHQYAHLPATTTPKHPLSAPAASQVKQGPATPSFGSALKRTPDSEYVLPAHKERLAIKIMEFIAGECVASSSSRQAEHLASSLASPSFPTLEARMKVIFARAMALARGEAARELGFPALQKCDVMTAAEAELFLAAFCEVRNAAGRVVFRRYFRVTDERVVRGARGVGAVAAAAGRCSRLVSAFDSKKARLDGLYSAGAGGSGFRLLAEVDVDGEGRGVATRLKQE